MSRALILIVGAGWMAVLAWSDLGIRGVPTPIERAHAKAVEYARVFGVVDRPISIVVLPRSEMPQSTTGVIEAHTTRSEDRRGCILHFNEDAVKDTGTIAHEVCHCALDWMVLDETGYIRGMSRGSVEFFEGRAQRCARWLTDVRLEAELERREGRVPLEITGR